MILVKRSSSTHVLTRSYIVRLVKKADAGQVNLTSIVYRLTARHSRFTFSFDLDDPLVPPVHLYHSIIRHCPLQSVTIGEGNEDIWGSGRVLLVDVAQSGEVAVVVVIVRDNLENQQGE